jgi:membrane fusion protein, multidrug efflux system
MVFNRARGTRPRSSWMRSQQRIARSRAGLARLAIGCLIALPALALGCKDTPPPAPPPDVVVADVVQKDVPIYFEWVGTTDGNINAQIRARVNGYLQTRNYTEGYVVNEGDLLFQIDPRPYQAALDQAKGELGRAMAALTKTQQDVTRYTPLAKEGAVSQQELDNSVQANRSARAAVDSARAAVEKAKLDLDWTRITSPISGIAGIAVAQVGDLISESTILTTVSQVDPIKVSIPISEQEYLRFASRVEARQHEGPAKANVQLILADGSVYPEPGTVSVANREVDVQTGTMMIVTLFPNPRGLLRPGQYAKVRAATETKHGAVVVPQRSVQELQGTYQVAVVDGENKVAIRGVKAGARAENLWVIDEGLRPGERVIVEGVQKVRDGLTVNPVAEPAVAAAPPRSS